jgi:hypothetical protein
MHLIEILETQSTRGKNNPISPQFSLPVRDFWPPTCDGWLANENYCLATEDCSLANDDYLLADGKYSLSIEDCSLANDDYSPAIYVCRSKNDGFRPENRFSNVFGGIDGTEIG